MVLIAPLVAWVMFKLPGQSDREKGLVRAALLNAQSRFASG